uniref:Uncharacterized protein n=1 Tax=Avena sativa TaxID=4498 RepID=A0ACD5UWC8_AVESA
MSMQRQERAQRMASNYVDTTGEEGTFHAHGHHSSSTTPTGSAASPRTTRRRWPGSASAPSGAGHSHGPAYKCVCAPATHPGSFKCRLHRTNSQGRNPSSPTAADDAAPSSSSRTVAAQ